MPKSEMNAMHKNMVDDANSNNNVVLLSTALEVPVMHKLQ